MPSDIPGIHHVTAIAGDPGRNLRFYTETLGLRLVKRSVNQDDVSVYHLFYGDDEGSPGTSMTFFPYQNARPGQVGTGQASATQFLIPAESVEYWTDRFEEEGVEADEPRERFGDTVIPFSDPDGLPLELVARDDAPAGNPPDGPVPEAHAIRGFFGATLSLDTAGAMPDLLGTMGFEEAESDHDRTRYEADGELGYVVDILEDPQGRRGRPGAGTVHHVAFRVAEDEQAEWREVLQDRGLRPTEIIDRKWFKSVYARTDGGVLFEFATKEPGYTVDEDRDELGERLVLPEWLEDRRDEIAAGLPELPTGPTE
ncbi:VOC family protein [Halopelagius longus]|uniref:Glyoxalase family protein n=1 Tax=Halopelagius longus TaxID=1236180 RepID=A0A1H0XU15_9EURY|nr:VOC family protein [Halopelagius longus]RDI72091.1 ring-cleaving dioxygenase [Halopelagius longus]SDQ06355.1 glyoxalase family protein [Halopelagius longus]